LITVGLVEATLRLRDELSKSLRKATRGIKALGKALRGLRRVSGRKSRGWRRHVRRVKALQRRTQCPRTAMRRICVSVVVMVCLVLSAALVWTMWMTGVGASLAMLG
jgi:hypothetical protein